jgi:hypothetical protein
MKNDLKNKIIKKIVVAMHKEPGGKIIKTVGKKGSFCQIVILARNLLDILARKHLLKDGFRKLTTID